MNSARLICVLLCWLSSPVALSLGLAEITYPVFLPYDQGDQTIEVRSLPFATHFAHPDFIGSALSARYVVPNNDSSDRPKDINLISVCGVTIETSVAKDGSEGEGVTVALKIDLTRYGKPDYVPATNEQVLASIAEATLATLSRYECRLGEIDIKVPKGQAKWRELLLQPLENSKGEAGTGQPATRPAVEPEGGDKPQTEAEGRSR